MNMNKKIAWPTRLVTYTQIAALCLLSVGPAWSLPEGAVVANGDVQFEQQGNTLTVNQGSGRAIVNFNSFDIGAGETVRFQQPGSSSAILSRVVGGRGSLIAGQLQANGDVYLINPSGILFTPSAQVNVHGLVASALNMSDGDFLAGNLNFYGPGGSVVNQGSLNGSYVYLIGGQVANQGSIQAGQIVLAAGAESVKIGDAGGGQIQLIIDGVDQSLGSDAESDVENDSDSVVASDSDDSPIEGNSESDDTVAMDEPLSDGLDAEDGPSADSTAESSGSQLSEFEGEDGVLVQDVDEETAAQSPLPTATQSDGDVVNVGTVTALADADGNGGTVAAAGLRVAQLGEITANAEFGNAGRIVVDAEDAVILGAGSVTAANAGQTGQGGTILLTSDASTYIDAAARLEATGGATSGNGGFVETSGQTGLYVGAAPNIQAVSIEGRTGTWLIDPHNISIENAPGGANQNVDTSSSFWNAIADSAVVDVNQVQSTVLAGGYVSVETGAGGGSEDGNITVNAPLDFTGAGAFSGRLDLRAHNDIQVLNPINAGAGQLDITLEADRDGSGAGLVNVASDIHTGGGSFRAEGVAFTQVAGTLVDTDGGNVVVVVDEDITVDGTVDARGSTTPNQLLLSSTDGEIHVGTTGALLIDGSGSASLIGNRFENTGSTDVRIDGSVEVQNGELVVLADNSLQLGANSSIRATGSDGKILLGTLENTGSVVQQGGIVETAGGDVVAFGGTFTQNGGAIATTGDGDAVMRFLGDVNIAGQGISADTIAIQANANVLNEAALLARSDLLVDSSGGSISGTGVFSGDRVGLKALGDIGSDDDPLNISALSMLLVESIEGVSCVTFDGEPQLDGEMTFGYSMDFVSANASTEFIPKEGTFIPIQGPIQSSDAIAIPTPAILVTGDPELTPKVEPEPPVVVPPARPSPPVVIVPVPVPEPEPEPEPEPVPEPTPTPAAPVPVVAPAPAPLPPAVVERGFVREIFDPTEIYILDTVVAATTDEQPMARERASLFNEFYFLHQSMQISEFSMELDLNFVDYLLFGSAQITPNAKFPVDVKDRIYIGGERPFQIFRTDARAPLR